MSPLEKGDKAPPESTGPVTVAVRPDPASPRPVRVHQAVQLARLLQERARALTTPGQRRRQAELGRMFRNPGDKATLVQLTDQAFRAREPRRSVDQMRHILGVRGIPRFLPATDRILLKSLQRFGGWLPAVAAPRVKQSLYRATTDVILPAEREGLARRLADRGREGLRISVNFLGEAVLSEPEAERRLQTYLEALRMPEIEVLSIKISTLYSQISPLARKHTVARVSDRLAPLYRAAANASFSRPDGKVVPKFVYMDMEEYRDMELTAEAFMGTLDRPGMEDVRAGIALQAYLPDAYPMQLRLNEWARRRIAAGGAPITLRIVKGANMQMERVEASLRGWPQAPYKTKVETDANYKRMLNEGMKPENLAAVRLGIASHNLFELAYALQLSIENDALDQVQFEMLEGMANDQSRALFERTNNLLLYAPACRKEDFIHAIGYLVRRLDESTGPENFLSHVFEMTAGNEAWMRLQEQFLASYDAVETVSSVPRRSQDRNQPVAQTARNCATWQTFEGEPDTDFSLPRNTAWAEGLLQRWHGRCGDHATAVPLFVAGREIADGRQARPCLDPSRPGAVVGRYFPADERDIEEAVACGRRDEDGWRAMHPEDRAAVLRRAAQEIRCSRADLMGAAAAEAGKILTESDPEVSEAVDFVEFYTATADDYHRLEGVRAGGRGVVVVVTPWNFPIAIPCGGVAAALAAGNTVILKPASDTVLVAHLLCECFWRAGVSRRTLQLIPCSGATAGERLALHGGVDAVILTGGTETARRMLHRKPPLNLLAETGGKNATIVTALSDRDQAIKHVLHSAFSHAGQKCSATSLLILEEEVYEDDKFRRALCDAVSSLSVGSAWRLRSRIGPLIRPPRGVLERGLKELEEGESWAVEPRFDPDNPHLVTPAVKWGVRPGGFTHMTELFGPVLGVMKAADLHEAISLVNATGYGLTSGLESLDEREHAVWLEGIRAGNLYVNRPTTGAVVLRQPFGGMGKSAFGPGIKAGGPNYVAQLMDFSAQGNPRTSRAVADPHLRELRDRLAERADPPDPWPPEEARTIVSAIESYTLYMEEEFGCVHDHFRLIGQDNLRRYLPAGRLRIRVHADDSAFDLFGRVCAGKAAGCAVTVSRPPSFASAALIRIEDLTRSWEGAVAFVQESDEQLCRAIDLGRVDRLRYAAPDRVPDAVRRAAAETGLFIAAAPVQATGRIELLWYLREQSLSINYHRYGNLGARAGEARTEPL